MTCTQEDFIAHLSACLGRSGPPARPAAPDIPGNAPRRIMADADSVELKRIFRQNSEANSTQVLECSLDELGQTLVRAVEELGGRRAVLSQHPLLAQQGVPALLQDSGCQCWVWDTAASREENIKAAEQADVGLSVAEMGLAETGTVVLFCHGGSGRSLSLLPAAAITVVRAADLRPRLTQAMDMLDEMERPLPPAINLVSGASSTADIELVRVVGVHGPVRLIYVVVD